MIICLYCGRKVEATTNDACATCYEARETGVGRQPSDFEKGAERILEDLDEVARRFDRVFSWPF